MKQNPFGDFEFYAVGIKIENESMKLNSAIIKIVNYKWLPKKSINKNEGCVKGCGVFV